jgi:hypothetical protein
MPELIWDGKYKDGKKAGPVRIALPFQTVETVNESSQDRQRSLELFSTDAAMNLRCYYPDFVAVDTAGVHWLLETKGQESPEVAFKDRAAAEWCENAEALTGTAWHYRKVPQGGFQSLQPATLADLQALG